MNLDYGPPRRAPRRPARTAASRAWFWSAGLALALVLLVFSLDQRLRGPVATADRVKNSRNAAQAAMAERAFLAAQLALANTDSLSIVLDARESRLWIVMKGVKLRECRLPKVAFDGAILELVSGGSEAFWLDRPFMLKERRGRLPDPWQPLMEGKIDTLKGGVAARELPMDGSLVFDRDLVLHIVTPPTKADSLELRGFRGFLKRLEGRRLEAATAWRETFQGPTSLDVYLQISREDAAAVLRALPVGGGMALRI